MELMNLRRGLMAQMAGGSKLKKLMTLTFSGEVQERKTINPEPSWSEFDFLLIVPNLVISSQEGQTSGNWLWYSIKEGTNNAASNYDGASILGIRDNYYTVVVLKGVRPSDLNPVWSINCWISGRVAQVVAHDGATIADLTIMFGLYYGTTYGIATGTAEVYGGKY